jgi:hypothetical protein
MQVLYLWCNNHHYTDYAEAKNSSYWTLLNIKHANKFSMNYNRLFNEAIYINSNYYLESNDPRRWKQSVNLKKLGREWYKPSNHWE